MKSAPKLKICVDRMTAVKGKNGRGPSNFWAYYEGYKATHMHGYGTTQGMAEAQLRDLWEDIVLQMEADRILAGKEPRNLMDRAVQHAKAPTPTLTPVRTSGVIRLMRAVAYIAAGSAIPVWLILHGWVLP